MLFVSGPRDLGSAFASAPLLPMPPQDCAYADDRNRDRHDVCDNWATNRHLRLFAHRGRAQPSYMNVIGFGPLLTARSRSFAKAVIRSVRFACRAFFKRQHRPFLGKNNRRADGEIVCEPLDLGLVSSLHQTASRRFATCANLGSVANGRAENNRSGQWPWKPQLAARRRRARGSPA